MLKMPTIARPIRHLRRYRHILTVFTRHGFGFAFSHFPTEPLWLRDLYPFPTQEPATLPVHFRQALEELGPTFVKLGQMLSTRPDLLPPDYITELAKLQDEVPPVPWPKIRAVLEEEMDRPLNQIFGEIDPEPLAAASLAQVHTAKLLQREKVVIKIQRPNILPTIKTDLEILQDLARYAEHHTPLGKIYHLVDIAEDFSNTLKTELNYLSEARNAERLRENFEGEPSICIPHVYWEYTTGRVLVLEYIYGIKISDIPALDAAGHNREAIANAAARMILKEVLEDGFFHADPHPGNLVIMEDGAIGVMDFGMVGYLSDIDRVNLIRLYNVAVRLDARGVVDELIHIEAAPPNVDRRGLARDIERLLQYYQGQALKELRVDEMLNDVMPIAFEHHLQFPANLWLLGKTLSMMEGIGLKLAPDFDIFAFSAPYVTRLIVKSALPKRHWADNLMRRVMVWGDLLDELPHAGMLLLDRLEKYESLKLSLDTKSLDRIDHLTTRMVLSMIIASMIIGLSNLIPATINGHWSIQAIVIASFVVAFVIGLWLLISIVRKN